MQDLLKLSGKTAIVTGASSGIGRGIALELAKHGVNVAIAARRFENMKELALEIKAMGGKALAVKTDVTNEKDIENLVSETIKQFGAIDILVNNAGVLDYKPISEADDKHYDLIMNTNLKAYLKVAQSVIPEMIKNKGGKIINTASIAAFGAFDQIGVYCISKSGVVALTRSLALELGKHGINVNAIAPGMIESEMTAGSVSNEDFLAQTLRSVPLGRIGQPKDIAGVAVFLASDLSNYVTGTTIITDGGWTCHY